MTTFPTTAESPEPRPLPTQRLPTAVTLALLTEVVATIASARTMGDGPLVGGWPFTTFAGCLFVALAVTWVWTGSSSSPLSLSQAAVRWLPLLPALATLLAIEVRGLFRPGPLLACGIVAASGALVMVAAVLLPQRLSRWRLGCTLGGALLSGLALRVFELTVVSLDPSHGDMLPLVVLAGRNFLAGNAPYAVYHFPWPVPLTYLPLGWLPYTPLFLASVDPRWTSALAELTVLAAIFFAGRRPEQRLIRDAAVTLWATWFVATRLVSYDGMCAASPQWAALAWLAVLALERNRWTPLMLGASLATTLLTVPLVPFLAIAWYRDGDRGRARGSLVRLLAPAALVAALVVLPFFLWSPRELVHGIVVWFNDLDAFPRSKWREDGAWAGQPGLTGAFWTFHLETLLKPLQLVALVALLVSYVRRRVSLGPALVAAMLLFLAFNPIIWNYLWEAALVLALVTVAGSRSDPRCAERVSSPPSSLFSSPSSPP